MCCSGECSVSDDDRPLVLALMASAHIQFVLKVYEAGADTPGLPAQDPNKLHQSNSFFSAMKKRLNKTKSKDKVRVLLFVEPTFLQISVIDVFQCR